MRLIGQTCSALLAVFACACFACVLAVFALAVPLVTPVVSFVNDLGTGNYQALTDLFSPAIQQQIGGVAGVQSLLGSFENVNLNVTSFGREGDGWRLSGTLTARDGTTQAITLVFAPVDGQWRITRLDLTPQ